MEKWEYRLVNDWSAPDLLDNLGKQGWEAVAFAPNARTLLMKRKLR